jgi:hypothetical protein
LFLQSKRAEQALPLQKTKENPKDVQNVRFVHFGGFRERRNRVFDPARGEKYILYDLEGGKPGGSLADNGIGSPNVWEGP